MSLEGFQLFRIGDNGICSRSLFLKLLFCIALFFSFAATAENTNVLATPAVKEIAPGIFEIGQVRIHKADRSLSFPAAVNMTNGPIEYLLVSAVGKLHESVLRTEIDPLHIHLGALLLGAKGAQTNLTVEQFNTKEIPGEKIALAIEWNTQKGKQQLKAEHLVFNTNTAKVMTDGTWVYNGSQLHNGTFVAQRDGLIVAIMTDPLALVNNPRQGRENDEIWQVNRQTVPALNTPVRFLIRFKETNE